MINIIAQRHGNIMMPFSQEDLDRLIKYPDNKPLRVQIAAAKKERSYRHLCCYFGSCGEIAEQNFNEHQNTKDKVDIGTRVLEGFVDGFIVLPNGAIQWLPRRLDYENCDHPDAVKFINAALERHAAMMGRSIDEYVMYLNSKSFARWR